ncbi:hypothetical protein B0H16DRAFT_1450058 [Mycena metata]|uniref:Uncharacterized protein n=1 Tax=Mycena metata TaxID=1033252 RepID=A0AAD7K042_9AGAR|nr:hypothetical protein B0H16DRAFT_1450058 [Mycena metata]
MPGTALWENPGTTTSRLVVLDITYYDSGPKLIEEDALSPPCSASPHSELGLAHSVSSQPMLPSKSSKFELEDDSSPNFESSLNISRALGTDDPAPAEFSNSPLQPSASIYIARAGAWALPLHFPPHHPLLSLSPSKSHALPTRPPSLSPAPSLVPTIWSYVAHNHVSSLLWYLIKGYPFDTHYRKDYIKSISKAGPIMYIVRKDRL